MDSSRSCVVALDSWLQSVTGVSEESHPVLAKESSGDDSNIALAAIECEADMIAFSNPSIMGDREIQRAIFL